MNFAQTLSTSTLSGMTHLAAISSQTTTGTTSESADSSLDSATSIAVLAMANKVTMDVLMDIFDNHGASSGGSTQAVSGGAYNHANDLIATFSMVSSSLAGFLQSQSDSSD